MIRVRRLLFPVFAAAAGVCLIFLRVPVGDGIRAALRLSGEVLIPSLLPFMVLSAICTDMLDLSGGGKAIAFVMNRVLRLPASALPAVLFGFIGGYPVGMSITSRLYGKGSITKDDARHLSAFCVNAGPAFIVSVAGGAVAGSLKAGAVILFSTVTASFLTGLAYSRIKGEYTESKSHAENKTELSAALVNAVKSSQENILSVCMWVAVFSVFNAVVSSFVRNEAILLVLSAVSEITSGVGSALKLGGLPLAAAAVSFGGFSVLFQLMPSIKKCGIRIQTLLIFRIVTSILSFFITRLLLCFVTVEIQTFSGTVYPCSSNVPASAALLIMGAVLICDMDRSEIISRLIHRREYRL